MQIEINLALTVVTAILVLLVGRAIIARVGFLQTYSIPEPVVGGLIAAVLLTVARVTIDTQMSFDMRLQTPLLLIFFTTIGLGADIRTLAQGGKNY